MAPYTNQKTNVVGYSDCGAMCVLSRSFKARIWEFAIDGRDDDFAIVPQEIPDHGADVTIPQFLINAGIPSLPQLRDQRFAGYEAGAIGPEEIRARRRPLISGVCFSNCRPRNRPDRRR